MQASPVVRRVAPAAIAVLVLALAGCSTGLHSGASAAAASIGPASNAMMGGPMSGYRYSPTTCSVPASPPGERVEVVLADMGLGAMISGTAPLGAHMMLRSAPTTIPAGTVTFVATNRGWRTHELVVIPLPVGRAGARTAGPDGKVEEAGSLGEASTPCGTGSGHGITAGSASWVTITLPVGRYELICNLANHYVDGMYQELDVV